MTTVIDFVEDWISENVDAQAFVSEDGDDPRPRELAKECRASALQAGFSAKAIKAEFPDLVGRMAEAIDEAANAEVDHLASKDD